MGLLEKALQYKQEINKKGKETLIDTIIGPAETEFIKSENDEAEKERVDDIMELGNEDLKSVEPVEDELFILPDDTKQEFIHEDIAKTNDNSDSITKIKSEEIETEYLGPEDEPDLSNLLKSEKHENTESQEIKNNESIEKSVFSSKFRIVESQTHEAINEDSKSDNEETKKIAADVCIKPDKKFQDFVVLYEIGKEIIKSQSLHELYDTLLFSVMGQIGSASATLLVMHPENENALIVADSRGITIKNKNVQFDTSKGLFNILIQSKGVVDIEQFKHEPQYRDEYFQLIAIDARLFIPLRYDSKTYGALVLGDKITIGDYTEEEIDFIEQIIQFAAIAYEKVRRIEHLETNLQTYADEKNFWDSLYDVKQSIKKYPHSDYFISTAQNTMKNHGILSFAVYIKNNKDFNYSLLCTDEEDIFQLKEDVPTISKNSALINFLLSVYAAVDIEDFDRNKAIRETFKEGKIRNMTIFWIYPFKIADELLGFICVFRLRDYHQKEQQFEHFKAIADDLLSLFFSLKVVESYYINYIDAILPVFNRINKELDNAKRLSIPVTFILFTIKNLKRYYIVQGFEQTQDLLNKVEAIICSRLSDGDFTSKVDRNKYLIVLPGKNKKYSAVFANALKNEIVQQFSNKELQLLVTYLMAEYPEDGLDIFSLLDAID